VPPEVPKGRPGGGRPDDDTTEPNVTHTTAGVAVLGCPCGCQSRPGLDDPACLRHRLVPSYRDWPVYTGRDLGLDCDHLGPHCAAWRLRRGAA